MPVSTDVPMFVASMRRDEANTSSLWPIFLFFIGWTKRGREVGDVRGVDSSWFYVWLRSCRCWPLGVCRKEMIMSFSRVPMFAVRVIMRSGILSHSWESRDCSPLGIYIKKMHQAAMGWALIRGLLSCDRQFLPSSIGLVVSGAKLYHFWTL